MEEDMDFNCPICFELLSPPILQCENGHSTCAVCARAIEACPLCRSNMSGIRNFKLEEILEKLKNLKLRSLCAYVDYGCKELLKSDDRVAHERACTFRPVICEGKDFCGWNCNWTGKNEEIIEHFYKSHTCCNGFKDDKKIKIDFTVDNKSVEAINFQEGLEIFWYKHKVDVQAQKVFWLFQQVGLKKSPGIYYYEFEIYSGPIRKYKVTDFCKSSFEEADDIINSEMCVAISFKMLKTFLNSDGEVTFRYRIMKVKSTPPTATPASINTTSHVSVAPVASYKNPVHIQLHANVPVRSSGTFGTLNIRPPYSMPMYSFSPLQGSTSTSVRGPGRIQHSRRSSKEKK